jgi:citrate lyase beta subunit
VESAQEVRIAETLLGEIDPRIQIMVVLESAVGILSGKEIAASSPKVTAVLFGGGDLSGDIGCPMTWEPLLGARHLAVLAATSAHVDAIDVPFLDIEDMTGLEEETRRVQDLGFVGKVVIHPKQISIVNRVFSPSPKQVEWANQVLEAVQQSGQGAIRVGGRMVDAAISKRAKKIVQMAVKMED